MAYGVMLHYSDGTSQLDDEIFETEKEANDHGYYVSSCHTLGSEILHESNPGDYPFTENGLDFTVVEVNG